MLNPFALGFIVTLGGLAAIAVGLAATQLTTIWIYIAFALFAALGLDPVVRTLERRGLTRAWAIILAYIGFAVLIVAVLWFIIPQLVNQVVSFFTDLPTMIDGFEKSDLYHWLIENYGDRFGDMINHAEGFLTDPKNLAAIGGGVVQVGVTIGTATSGLIIVLVLSLYFLASLPQMKRALARLAPARNRATITDLTNQISNSIGGYLSGMVILAFVNAVLALILYWVLDLPLPLLMAVVAFCITLIPLVGSVLFWGIGTIVALLGSPISALVFAIVYLLYMQVEAYVLTPRVMNKAVSVPGSLVVIGAMVGGTLLGLLGALIAIPVTASILLIIKQVIIPAQDRKL